jgi:CIC family chloride channel protein
VFAPTLFAGAMLGGACAALAHQPFAPFVVVGMAAVFAGAARVPIATMMMVIEMTGGYTLLVPAALAVVLSYLVQTHLAGQLRYHSLYEAQVASRADSPAHHTEHLGIALRLLRKRDLPDLKGLGELDLVTLLRSGIPVELAGSKRLLIGVLRPDSRYVQTSVAESGRKLDGEGTNILAILRGEHMLAPRPDTILHVGDKLILVVNAEGVGRVREHLDAW